MIYDIKVNIRTRPSHRTPSSSKRIIYEIPYKTFVLTTVAPNGASESFAILKNCLPNGIPITVQHSNNPIMKFINASSRPETRNHITLSRNDTDPPSYMTSLPKGFSEIDDSLKHWSPTGIPTMVMHQRHPAITQPSELINPPNIIHNTFAKILIILSPSFFILICSFCLSAIYTYERAGGDYVFLFSQEASFYI